MGGNIGKNTDVINQLLNISDSLHCIITQSLDPPFDSESFEDIKYKLLNKKCGSIVMLKSQILILLDEQCPNRYSYAVQLDRLLRILDILYNRLSPLIIDICYHSISEELLCIFTVILSTIITIVHYLLLIIKYDTCSCCVYNNYIKCLICNLISEINDLENNIKCLCDLSIKIINYELDACSDCYSRQISCRKKSTS
ncbi:hypothetical protein [Clostridium sp.]|uniref:hypothetical protein n=1 Tax=Clostridium sp. TaxID=1506 RepID=UPI003F3EB9EF